MSDLQSRLFASWTRYSRFWGLRVDREFDDELQYHFEMRVQDYVARGMSDAEARVAARDRLGDIGAVRTECLTIGHRRVQSMARAQWLDAVAQDIRFSLRTLSRKKAWTTVAVVTIALGIGAATSIFGVTDAVLFRALPLPDPGRLIAVWRTIPEWKKNPVLAARWDRSTMSQPTFRDWRAGQTAFDEVALWRATSTIVGGSDAPEEVIVLNASASLLPVLRVTPALGRGFTPREDAVGGERVALVSHEVWTTRMAADPRALGRTLRIDGTLYTIVGILPRGLTIARSMPRPAYWIPAGQDSVQANQRGFNNYHAIGRLKAGASIAAATAEAERLFNGATPTTFGARLVPLQADETREVRRPLLILLGAAGVLLLIACANVATLLMGEATAREQEMRTRMALGAARVRLVRQLLTESVVLAGVGAVLGTVVAYWGTKVLVLMAPAGIPGLAGGVRVDGRILLVALAMACTTGLLFGLAPAFALSQSSNGSTLRASGQSARGRGRLQRSLIAIELALSMVLLVGAGLLVRSFEKLTSVNPGLQADHLLVMRLSLPQPQYADSARVRAVYQDLLARIRSIPGVAIAAATTAPPFTGSESSSSFEIEGRPVVSGAPERDAQRRVTTPDFFAAAGIPIVAGRAYTLADGAAAPPVMVITAALARQEWPNESPLGKRINVFGTWRTIVGVAGDIKFTLATDAVPTMYVPLGQVYGGHAPAVLVRTRGAPADLTADVRRALHDVAPDVAISRLDEMTSLVAASLADDRYRTTLISLFAGIACVLAAVGIYGVAATAASRRTREMAIRVALGASHRSVARLILGSAAVGVAIGVASGAAMTVLLTRVLSPYLFGVSIGDLSTYAGVLGILAATTLTASWLPARRAMRVQPVEALRGE